MGKLAADCLKAPEMRTVLHTASARVTESGSEANVKTRCGLTQIPSFTQITKYADPLAVLAIAIS